MSHVSLCLRIFPNKQTKKSGWNRKFWSEIWSIENKRLFMLLYVFIWRNLHHLSEWMTWCPRTAGHFCRWGNESENLAGCPGHIWGTFIWPFPSFFLTSDAGFPAGAILKLPFLGQVSDQNCFDDSAYWEVRHNLSSFSLCWRMYSHCSPALLGFVVCTHKSEKLPLQNSEMLLCLRLWIYQGHLQDLFWTSSVIMPFSLDSPWTKKQK